MNIKTANKYGIDNATTPNTQNTMYYNTFRNKYHAENISDVNFTLLDKLSMIDKHEYIVANTMTGMILHCTSSTYIFLTVLTKRNNGTGH